MSTNPINIERTSAALGLAVAPRTGHRLQKCQRLLWLALPLTLAAGCASGPNRSTATSDFTDTLTLVAAPISRSGAANVIVGHEIYEMFLADTRIDYGLGAGVDKGVVTLRGTSFNGTERQRIVDGIWELNGVDEVKDKHGVDVAPTLARNTAGQ